MTAAFAGENSTADINPSFIKLRLYVAGQSPKCVRAIENLAIVCREHLAGRYHLEVIDILENPALARGDEVIAVPTLVKRFPAPVRRIIGDMSDTDKVLVGLQVRARPSP